MSWPGYGRTNLYSRQIVIDLQPRNTKTHAKYSGPCPPVFCTGCPLPRPAPPLDGTENVRFQSRNPNLQHRTYKTPQLIPIRSQMNPVYKSPLYFKFLVWLQGFTACNEDFVLHNRFPDWNIAFPNCCHCPMSVPLCLQYGISRMLTI